MTQSTNNNQITSITEFVDSVFVELEALQLEYSSEVSSDYDTSKRKWKDTLIPLIVRIYELAQENDGICWWLLQKMSRIELCKEGGDFRKTDLFEVLTKWKQDPNRLRMILRNCHLNDVEELQQAVERADVDGFRNILNQTDGLIFDVGRVLMRFAAIRDIYERTVAEEGIETLAALFWLIRRLLLYFPVDRSCDAMAYNFFVALATSMYSDDESKFCELLTETGGLWIGSLMIDCIKNKDQMPQAVSQAMNEIFQKYYSYRFGKLEYGYNRCDTDEQRDSFTKEHGGCLEIEKYSFIYSVLESGPFFLPPFDWKKWRPGGVRYWRNSAEEYRYHIVDPLIKDWLTKEQLEELRTREGGKNIGSQESVVVSGCNPKFALEVKGHGVKDKDSNNELKPFYFPEEWEIPMDKRKEFLIKLHGKLKDIGYLKQDSLDSFIFIFSGYEDIPDEKVIFNPVDWGKGDDRDYRQLQVFCIAFYKMRMESNKRKTPPWKNLTPLFTVNGNLINNLSTNASIAFQEEQSIKNMTERITDVQKEILQNNNK